MKQGTSLFTVAILLLGCGFPISYVEASSHREAPFISQDPTADNTDLYAFVSPDKPDTVTIVANYIPLEEPAGGPNFTAFSDDVLYAIHIDNDGDGEEEISYQFRFTTTVRNPNTFLYNTGPITSLDDPNWNMPQTYSVTRVEQIPGPGQPPVRAEDVPPTLLGDNLSTPPVNIGPRSTPNYEALAAAAVHKLPGGITVFAGQRDDPFFVDLGSIFVLGGLRPFNEFHLIPLKQAPGVDGVGGFNTHSIVMQIPITQLTRTHQLPSGPDDPTAVIGIYASASRQRVRVLGLSPLSDPTSAGEFVPISRLGNPLINEVIIPLGQKDFWNRSDPADDSQFQQFYEKPELATLVNLLYPALPDARTTDRADLVAILLTGLPLPGGHNLNFTGPTQADLLRLNMAIPPTAGVCAGNPMGVLAKDLAGFPNGRRLEDDVVDIELRAVADGYGSFVNGIFGNLTPNHSPNNTVGDGVNKNDQPCLAGFPYVPTPHQGHEHEHHQVGSINTPPIP
jgi:hypothetical protein